MNVIEHLKALNKFIDTIGSRNLSELSKQRMEAVTQESDKLYAEIYSNEAHRHLLPEIIKLDSALKHICIVASTEIKKFRALPFNRDGLAPFGFTHNSPLFAGLIEFCQDTSSFDNGYVIDNIDSRCYDAERIRTMMLQDPSLRCHFNDLVFLHGELEKIKFKIEYETCLRKFPTTALAFQKSYVPRIQVQDGEIIEIKDEEMEVEETATSTRTATSEGKTATSEGKTAASEGKTATSEGKTATSEGKTATSEGKTATSEGNVGLSKKKIRIISNEVIYSKQKDDSIKENSQQLTHTNEAMDINFAQKSLEQIHELKLNDDIILNDDEDILGFNDFSEDLLRETQFTQSYVPDLSDGKNLTASEKDFIKSFCNVETISIYNGFDTDITTLTSDADQIVERVNELEENFKKFAMMADNVVAPSGPENAISFGLKDKVQTGLKAVIHRSAQLKNFSNHNRPKITELLPKKCIEKTIKKCNVQTFAKRLIGEYDQHVKYFKEEDPFNFAEFYIRLLKKMEKLKITNAKLGMAKVELFEYNGEVFETCFRYDPKTDKFLAIKAENILFFGSKEQCLILEVIGINGARSTGFFKNAANDFGGAKFNSEHELYCVYVVERDFNDVESLMGSVLPIKQMYAIHLVSWATAKLRGITDVNICVLCRSLFNGYSSAHSCDKSHKLIIDGKVMTGEEFCTAMLGIYKKENSIEDLVSHLSFIQWILDETFVLSHAIFDIGAMYPLTCFAKYPGKVPAYYIPELNKFVSRTVGSPYEGMKIEIENPEDFLKAYISTENFKKLFDGQI